MSEYADVVIKSSTIFTAETLDTIEGAVVIRGKEIVDVVSAKEAEGFVGPNTVVYEAGDRLVLPGFNDSHTHFIHNGVLTDEDYTLNLEGITSKEEVCAKIAAFAKAHPESKWIAARGFNYDSWEGGEQPTKEILDELVPDRPAYVASWDGHVGWVNSRGLEAAGYTPSTPDPGSAWIGRNDDGSLTGLVYEPDACDPVWGMANLAADMDRALGSTIREAISNGVTATGNVYPYGGIPEDDYLGVLQQFEREGKLPIRVSCFLKLEEGMQNAKKFEKVLTSEHLRFGGLKQLTDGVSEAHTAYQTEPYANDGSTCVPTIGYDELHKLVEEANSCGYSVRLHCIGNGAVKQALDVYEAVGRKIGFKGIRNAVEHIETCCPEDIERFAKLGVLPAMQPIHAVLNVDGYPEILGEKWRPYMWPIRSFIDAGAIVSFGTDAPVWHFNPMEGVYAAIERKQPWDGYPESGFVPEQRITLAQALQAYTYGSAYVENFEDRIGTLRSGKLADVVIMDRNLFAATPEEILQAKPLYTFIDGKPVYQADGVDLAH